MAFTLKTVDKGWRGIRELAKGLAQKDNYAKAGVLGIEPVEAHGKAPQPNRKDGAISNIELAMIHEYGAPAAGIPERSFIRAGFEAHRDEYVKMLATGLKKVFEKKMGVTKVLGLIGAKMAADMKNVITTGDGLAPLKQATIDRKGSSRPLVDTGQLVNSITWAVVKGAK